MKIRIQRGETRFGEKSASLGVGGVGEQTKVERIDEAHEKGIRNVLCVGIVNYCTYLFLGNEPRGKELQRTGVSFGNREQRKLNRCTSKTTARSYPSRSPCRIDSDQSSSFRCTRCSHHYPCRDTPNPHSPKQTPLPASTYTCALGICRKHCNSALIAHTRDLEDRKLRPCRDSAGQTSHSLVGLS